ncbi:MAG: glycosyltransferase [Phycisphaerales bacterium]|nr:glycosyltransferase [Phycisphaerales bacterium]
MPSSPSTKGTSRVRIGQLIQTVHQAAGGTTTAFLGTLSSLSAAGLEWRAFTERPSADDPVWAQINARADGWTLADRTGAVRPGDLGAKVAGAIAKREIDLLHMHGVWCADHLVAARACRRAGVPYVWQPHGMLLTEAMAQKRWKKELFLALGGRAALAGAASVLFVTSDERDHSPLPAGVARRDVVPLAVEMPSPPVDLVFRRRARERFGLPADAPVVCSMGRLHPVKRIDLLLEAFAVLPEAGKDARLLLVGGGEPAFESGLREKAERLGIAGRVVFAGWVRGEDKWLALAAGDVLSLQSVHENFGFVAVEALGVGTLPVLTSNLSLADELSRAGMCEAAEPTPAGLAGAISRGLLRRRSVGGDGLLSSGPEWVQATLSPKAIGSRLGAVYGACRGGRG